jgi:hypothetical protein
MKYYLIFLWLDTSLIAHTQELIRSDRLKMFSTPEACSTEQHRQEFLHKTDVVLLSACTQTSATDGTIIFKMNVK